MGAGSPSHSGLPLEEKGTGPEVAVATLNSDHSVEGDELSLSVAKITCAPSRIPPKRCLSTEDGG